MRCSATSVASTASSATRAASAAVAALRRRCSGRTPRATAPLALLALLAGNLNRRRALGGGGGRHIAFAPQYLDAGLGFETASRKGCKIRSSGVCSSGSSSGIGRSISSASSKISPLFCSNRFFSRVGHRAEGDFLTGSIPLDPDTVKLHKAYHDKTIEYTMENFEWVNSKKYVTDEALAQPEEELRVWRASKARNLRWPKLEERDMHPAPVGSQQAQRFVKGPDGLALGDPMEHVFVINLMRRPSKLRRMLSQLHEAGVSATIVDAIDGDAFTSQTQIDALGARTLPGYCGHKNTLPELTTGQLGCFMSHFTIWQHMVDNNIPSALILEDDVDLMPNFVDKLGEYLEEARHENWNLMYLGRSPTEGDHRRASTHLMEPGYTLWTCGYIFRLDAVKPLVEAQVQSRLAPLDHYFSIAMGKGLGGHWNENALHWAEHIPQVLRGLAITPPIVMPYAGSMFLSDTAMFRNGTKFMVDLPMSGDSDVPLQGGGPAELRWREDKGVPGP